MSKVKCKNCGVVNWATVEKCVRCWADPNVLLQRDPEESDGNDHPAYLASEHKSSSALTQLLLLGAIGGAVLICICFFLFKRSPAEQQDPTRLGMTASALADDAMSRIHSAADKGATELAAPPPELGVVQPSLEFLMSHAQAELKRDLNNGQFSESNNFTSTPMDKQWDEVYKKSLGDCWESRSGSPGCESQRASIQADIDAREHNRMMNSIRRTTCPGRVGGTVTLRNAGHYNKFDDTIYFSVKVYAPGEEGAIKDGQCIYKPAIAGLTTTMVLKFDAKKSWLNWQLSSKEELSNVGYYFNKKESERRKEELELERSKKWAARR